MVYDGFRPATFEVANMPSLAMLIHSFMFVFIHKPRAISIICTQASLRNYDLFHMDHSLTTNFNTGRLWVLSIFLKELVMMALNPRGYSQKNWNPIIL